MAAVFPLCLPACLASQLENDPNPTDPEKKNPKQKTPSLKMSQEIRLFPEGRAD